MLSPRGSTAIVFEGHELGHVYPDGGTLGMPLPDERRPEVLNAGRAKEWPSGWVTKPLDDDADAQDKIALLRQSYDERRSDDPSRAFYSPPGAPVNRCHLLVAGLDTSAIASPAQSCSPPPTPHECSATTNWLARIVNGRRLRRPPTRRTYTCS
jgi:hypothetical protein